MSTENHITPGELAKVLGVRHRGTVLTILSSYAKRPSSDGENIPYGEALLAYIGIKLDATGLKYYRIREICDWLGKTQNNEEEVWFQFDDGFELFIPRDWLRDDFNRKLQEVRDGNHRPENTT